VNKAVAEAFLSKVEAPLVPVMFECHWESGQQQCSHHAWYIDGIPNSLDTNPVDLPKFEAGVLALSQKLEEKARRTPSLYLLHNAQFEFARDFLLVYSESPLD